MGETGAHPLTLGMRAAHHAEEREPDIVLVFDGDYPMAYSGTDANRDLTKSLADVRATPLGPRDIEEHIGVLATLPEMRRGRVCAALV